MNQIGDFPGRSWSVLDREVSRGYELSFQFSALGRSVKIVQDSWNQIHVKRCHVAKHQELNDRNDEKKEDRSLVPKHLPEFFDHNLPDSFKHSVDPLLELLCGEQKNQHSVYGQ